MKIRDALAEVLEGLGLPNIGDLELGKPTPRLLSQVEQQPLARRVAGWVGRGLDPLVAEAVLQRELKPTHALDQVQAWHRNRNFAWLRILGGRGTGKSWAASWWLMQGAQADARLITGAQTVRWWPRDPQWAELDRVPRLVIDDPDITGSDPAPWYSVMEARHRGRLPTIVTSNAKTREDFWAWWGGFADLLQSRFREIGTVIQAGGEDMRVRKAMP